MSTPPDLDGAYALSSAKDVQRLYADWADSYDAGFAATRGYALHHHVAAAYARTQTTGPILDIGAGTGLVAESLLAVRPDGADPIDGTDISADMLAVAGSKQIYRTTFVADINAGLPCPDASYAGALSAGTFTLGHVGPEALAEVVRVVSPGGWIVISVNIAHWQAQDFPQTLADLAPKIAAQSLQTVNIYSNDANHDHQHDTAIVLSLQVA